MSRTWLITGTSSGFGRELTAAVLDRGDRVAATVRRLVALDDLAAAHPDRLFRYTLDVRDAAAVRSVVDRAFADLGRIDVVVSNAGYALLGAAEECTQEQTSAQLETNVLGSIHLARCAVPHLRAQGGGRILQLSSMGGLIAFPGLSLYHASKWAMEGFYESFGPEVADFGIETCLVEPGGARTDFGGRSLATAQALDAYADSVAGTIRAYAATRDDATIPGDPAKMAAAMIDAEQADVLPQRLVLGSDAYRQVTAGLAERLAAIEAQRDTALATDAEDYAPAGSPLRA
jgi:NAD(P)-dependent dehydrogenase (short-subunit alcohol dehydrogenase family)